MQTQVYIPQSHLNLKSLVSIIIPAAAITLALFWGMQKLIANNQIPRTQVKQGPIIDLFYDFTDTPVITKTPIKPMPKPKPMPKAIPQIEEPNTQDNWDPGLLGNTFTGPSIKIADTPTFTLAGGEARPIVRIEPKYPAPAAREGIEGWVRLAFSITPMGTVENIQVIDAQPKRIFDKAAKRALSKWKYKPNIVAGKPQPQDGMMVMLDFKLAS
ncbi:energy transducer TonB [Paraglaciecola aquimarina]|uniref:Protein TonB n=1 Tax=Paraglaciecola algarum TaxID=3050085 RepID=A0ABS9DDT4_9ALTE|nr:energy transducer TonB [Paraglaciecola sp. G1-23]MCF2949914.1 energy transducer TonB [Paraglaciecola sp. G1-23]